MKRSIVICIGISGVIGCIAVATLLGQKPQQNSDNAPQPTTTTVTTSTQQAAKPTDSSESRTTQTTTPRSTSQATMATYIKYDPTTFSQLTHFSRVIFFYSQDHAPSVALDKLIATHLKDLPPDTIVLNAPYSLQYKLADDYGVSQPGTAIKIDGEGQVTSVYIAPDAPTIEGFMASLSLTR